MKGYTGKHSIGDIVYWQGKEMVHECKVTGLWKNEGRNGVSIIPTGDYGFEMDVYEDQLYRAESWKTEEELNMPKQIHIRAESFRDKAWGIAQINDEVELVLEMTCGYSDLYYRDTATKDKMGEDIFLEEPNHRNINKFCIKVHNIKFI